MKLSELRRYLAKRSAHPKNLPGVQVLGSGSTRTAFRVGRYVVKRNDGWSHRNHKVVIPGVYRTVPPVVVRPRGTSMRNRAQCAWDIQPYVGPSVGQSITNGTLTNDAWLRVKHKLWSTVDQLGVRPWGDFHMGNVALNRRGEIVQFD